MAGTGTICGDGTVILSGNCPAISGLSPLDDALENSERAGAAKNDADAAVKFATTNLTNAKTKYAAATTNSNSPQGKAYPADAQQAVNCNQAAVAKWTTVLTLATEMQKLADAAVKEADLRVTVFKENAKVKQLEDNTIPWSYDLYQAAKNELQLALESMNLALFRYASAFQSYKVALIIAENASESARRADQIWERGGLTSNPSFAELQKICDTLQKNMDTAKLAMTNARQKYTTASPNDKPSALAAYETAADAYALAKNWFDEAQQLLVKLTYGNEYQTITRTAIVQDPFQKIDKSPSASAASGTTDINIDPKNWQ